MALSLDKIPIKTSYVFDLAVKKATDPISTAVQKLESNGGRSVYLEAQGVYNKAVFNIAQSALEKAKTSVAQIREKISSLIPEGKDYFYDAEGVLKIADSKEAALLAKEAYFHKNISQIEADNKAI